MAERDEPVATGREATTHTGPLGSTIHVLRADAGTIAELAGIDWNRSFSRVCLDPIRGLITLMTPSRLHEDRTDILARIVDAAGSAVTGKARDLRHTRLRAPADPPDTGMEPDCAFYLALRAREYRTALAEGEAAADAFLERTPLDLVVEAEITHGRRVQDWPLRRFGSARTQAAVTSAKAAATCEWNSLPCGPGRCRAGSPLPRFSAASRRTTSARPWMGCVSV